jgi:hypothetical protein
MYLAPTRLSQAMKFYKQSGTHFWSCESANDRTLLSQAGNAYNRARLKVRHTSTIPLSPPVIRYSPSRLSNKH